MCYAAYEGITAGVGEFIWHRNPFTRLSDGRKEAKEPFPRNEEWPRDCGDVAWYGKWVNWVRGYLLTNCGKGESEEN